MKKILIAILLLSGITLNAQVAYYDALKIKKAAGPMNFNMAKKVYCLPDNDDVYKILKYYVPSIDSTEKKKIEANFDNNPFILFCNKSLAGGDSDPGSKSFFSSIGGLDVTKFVKAIAEIMIDRAKQELTVAFFNRFQKFAKDNPEFKILFPKTTDNLKNLLTYKYTQMLPALRTGFFEDLKQITYHLDDVLDLPRYQTLLKNFPEVKMAVRSVRLIHEIETGASNAADIITEFASFKEWDENNKMKSAGSCLKIASFLSESLRNDTSQSHTNDIWIPAKDLKGLYNDTVLHIYMGLLYQLSVKNDIKFIAPDNTPTQFSDLLKAQKDNIFLFQNKLKEFADLTGNVNTAFKDLQKKIKNDEKPSDDDIYNYINTSIDIVDYCFSIIRIFKQDAVTDSYLAVARKSNDLYKSIYTKQYSQAINDALDIFTMLNDLIKPGIDFNTVKDAATVIGFTGTQPAQDAIKRLREGDKFLNKIKDKDIDDAVAAKATDPQVQQLIEHYTLQKLAGFIQKVKPYALFIANMVEAKDEKEVKAALENVILPVGSSSIKKNTRCNISIQTYFGAFFTPSNENSSVTGTWSDRFGVTAPIGISWTPNFLSWQKGGSISLFGSFFDIGAIVDYKLKKEPNPTSPDPNATVINKDYKIELGHIFSPGVYAVYGFGANLPLALGFGAQYGPGLSKIDAGNNTVITNPSWRCNLFLAVDLPFFTLVNKPKHKK